MNIQILSVNVTTKQGKKPYQNAEIAYKDLEQGRVSSKNLTEYEDSFKILSKAQSGETYELRTEKNDAGFWTWRDVKKSVGVASPPMTEAPNKEKFTPTKSTYETPEERAKKQVYIVRQSSLSNAIDYYKHPTLAKANVTEEDVIKLAEKFTSFVFDGLDITNNLSLKDMENDLPF